MECRYVSDEELSERYLNGQLAGPLQDEFEVHLLECPGCVESLESLRDLRSAVASDAPRIRLAPGRQKSPFWFWTVVTASLLILTVFALFQWRRPGISVAENQPPLHQQVAPQANPQPEPSTATASGQKKAPKAEREAFQPIKSGQPADADTSTNTQASATAALETPTPQIEQPPATIAQAKPSKVQPATESEPRQLTPAEAIELYKLAEVHPAQYSPAEHGAGSLPSKAAAVDIAPSNGSTASVFQQAMVAYMQQNYDEAREMLESAALTAPESATINYYLGVCRLLVGRTDEGLASLNRVIVDGKSKFVQGAHIYVAKGYLQKADLKDAEQELVLASNLPGKLTTEASLLLARVRALRASVDANTPQPPQ